MTVAPARAQRITCNSQVIDCGQVLFRKPVTVHFELLNEGGGALNIKNVESSCGCTDVVYPKGAISENKPFVITATYDAKQLGHFEKYIDVYTSGSNEPIMLTLRGVVVAERKGYEGNYSFAIGRLKTDREELEYDDVNRGERPVQEIHILNSSSDMATPTFMHLPPYLKAEVSPTTISPGRSGVARITLDSEKLNTYGLVQTNIFLGNNPGDKVSQDKEISVSTIILPNFEEMTASQLAQAPRLELSEEELMLTFGKKKRMTATITLKNTGASMLDINSMQMFTTGLKVSLSDTHIAPGEEAKMKITADKKELKAARSKPRILMITNDPKLPKRIIKVNVQ